MSPLYSLEKKLEKTVVSAARGRSGGREMGSERGLSDGRPEKASGFCSQWEGKQRVCVELRCDEILVTFHKVTWLLCRRQGR